MNLHANLTNYKTLQPGFGLFFIYINCKLHKSIFFFLFRKQYLFLVTFFLHEAFASVYLLLPLSKLSMDLSPWIKSMCIPADTHFGIRMISEESNSDK